MTVSRDESFIASTYYESMRDNFAGYAWDIDASDVKVKAANEQKTRELDELKKQFDALDPLGGFKPKLGQLFEIELALVWLIPDTALEARFWSIEDRFHRVVPKGVAKAYSNSIAAGPHQPVPPEILRQRARNLLDVIHSNYLINFAREVLIRRLMTIMAGVAFAIILTGTLGMAFLPTIVLQGLLLILVAGMAGAMISIMQRLQKATSRDAMVDDGIFELIGLRIGWVSVLMSVGIGGVLALLIYVLVSGDLLNSVLPQLDGAGAGDPEPAADASGIAPPCGTGNPDGCPYWADRIFRALGLESRTDLFKMIGYAFASGFAERFVPDIINKLAKDAIPVPGGGDITA